MNTQEKLNQLAEYMAQKELMELDKKKLVDAVYTDEIRAKIADIELEFSEKTLGVDENINNLTKEIKDEVVALGDTVKGENLMAVYAKGRVSWDTKTLDGLMLAIPQLSTARKQGDPSVSIRKI